MHRERKLLDLRKILFEKFHSQIYTWRILRLRIILLKISLDNFLQSEHFCRIVTLNIHLRKILSKDWNFWEFQYLSFINGALRWKWKLLLELTRFPLLKNKQKNIRSNSRSFISNFTLLYKQPRIHCIHEYIGVGWYHSFREFKASRKMVVSMVS